MIAFVITMLAMFSIASILYQIKPIQKVLLKYDPLGLLPNYSFFAPKPISNDFRIVYRVKDRKEWEEVPMYQKFYLFRFLWNPFKYYNKGFIDSCQAVHKEYSLLKDKNLIQLSIHYLNLLSVVAKVLRSPSPRKRSSLPSSTPRA
ncbi:hypothetical protein KFE98_01180 [bacterium SCSIO 12741]|nr:hypothetical protein KFE98_01180 [bacterium SCSIO 12741]